jgi:hypothetical protein
VDEADLTLFQILVNAAKHTSSMKVLHMLFTKIPSYKVPSYFHVLYGKTPKLFFWFLEFSF